MSLFFKKRTTANTPLQISWSIETARIVRESKTAISQGLPEKALNLLFELRNSTLDTDLTLFSSRLAKFKQENRFGVQTFEEHNVGFNRLCRDILELITSIEKTLPASQTINVELRAAFRLRYRDRLAQKLASRQPVNLRRFATTKGTSKQVAATFIPYNTEEIKEEIGKTFQEAYGRLLIVGQPGAGKTILLLQLADRLFDLETDALPVVLNLATWQSSFGKLETWLEEVMVSELSTNKAGVRTVLRQSKLILLLDGLDELKEDEAINSCLAAIADYGAVAGRRFVITSRIEEYKRVKEDARVNLQIEVGPLQGDQLEAELTRMGRNQPEALPLLQAIQKDRLLRHAIETPFYFNTLQLLFAGRLPVFTTKSLGERKNEIKEKFVTAALQNTQKEEYLPDRVANWLAFLAFSMNSRNAVTFELRDLQYDWWHRWTRWNRIVFNFIKGMVRGGGIGLTYGVIIGLMFGLIFGLMFGLVNGLIWGLVGGIISGILSGIISGIFLGFSNVLMRALVPNMVNSFLKIDTRDAIRWSLRAYVKAVKNNLVYGLLFVLLSWQVYGSFALIIGLALGLILVLIRGLDKTIENEHVDFIQIKSPYQRFYASMKVLHFSIFQHWHLRYLLYKKGVLPFDLVIFLNEMVARNLLEADGATWRFRHRIIQDYFAEQWKEDE